MSRVVKAPDQIIREWRAIEARRPGGGFDQVVNLLDNLSDRATGRECELIRALRVINESNRDYHVEMGVLIEALEAAHASD